MGEYATFEGKKVKIGTCENLYYLRFDQRRKVQALPGNVDPVGRDAYDLRFRFPFPDEDDIEPADFRDHDRHFETGAPALYEGIVHRGDCKAGRACIVQQRLVTDDDGQDRLVLICRCSACGVLWRCGTVDDAAPVVTWLLAQARSLIEAGAEPTDEAARQIDHFITIARRILDGYSGEACEEEAAQCS